MEASLAKLEADAGMTVEARTGSQRIARILRGLALLWVIVAAVVAAPALFDSADEVRAWTSIVLIFLVPSGIALIVAYVIDRFAKRGN